MKEEVSIQAPEFRTLSDSMELTTDKKSQEEWMSGVLIGADLDTHRFKFWRDGIEDTISGRFVDAISEVQKAELPRRYSAFVQTTTQTTLATDSETKSYSLLTLKPA